VSDPVATGAPAPASPGPARRLRFHHVLWALVAFIVGVTAMRTWVVDVYRVAEQSMWPTLVGGRDHILVQRLSAAPLRFDVWLYEGDAEDDERPFVKRVVGLEGEYVDLRVGDLYVGDDPMGLVRALRSPGLVESFLVSVYPTPDGRSGPERFNAQPDRSRITAAGSELRLDARGLAPVGLKANLICGPGTVKENIQDDHVGADGTWHLGRHSVPDVRVDVVVCEVDAGSVWSIEHDLEGEAADRILELGEGRLRVKCGRGADARECELVWDGVLPVALRMETIDGHFRVQRKDRDTGEILETLIEERRDTQGHHGASCVRMGLDCGRMRLADLHVARDVYWFWTEHRRPSGPYHVDRGVFLLGDNPPLSRDSRDHGPVSRTHLLGRVSNVVWPRADWRRLPR